MAEERFMTEYKVTWTIDILAYTAEEAVSAARKIQLDNHSTATVFDVENIDGKNAGRRRSIDLA